MFDAARPMQPAVSAAPRPVEVILAGNGPGELQGWIAPVARALRAAPDAAGVRLTLALTPTQFAGGRERDVAASWRLFDEILDPSQAVRIALGLQRRRPSGPGVLVHLGGDLLWSGRLAARVGVPACAFAETALVARRHRYFRRIFAATEPLARTLAARGVPREHLIVTGDPRGDLLPASAGQIAQDPGRGGGPVVSFLPGSRDRFFDLLAPFFLETARALTGRMPAVRPLFVVSEFLTPSRVEAFAAAVRAAADGSSAPWRIEQGWAAASRSDFAVTIPGTNTLELAMAGVPFAAVVPTQHLARIPVEGLLEWIARLPGLGYRLRAAALRRVLRRERFLAIPNRRAGRAIVPEWIGPLDPGEVAARLEAVLRDGAELARMAAALRGLDLVRPGASVRIAAEALRLAAPPAVR